MKKLILLLILSITLLFSIPSYALIHVYKGLIGGANANLDGVSVANISDGEIAIGADTSNTWGHYHYDASNNNTSNPESPPDVIVPDNSSGTGAWILDRDIEVHANLMAIADAEAGVSNPGITMYDDNGTGTGTAFIYGTTVDDNKDVVMSIGVEEEGSETPAVYIELDGINETVDVLKPLTAPGINAGTYTDWWNTHSDQTLDLDDTYPGVCDLTLVVYDPTDTDHDVEIELWNEGDCLTSGNKYGRKLTIIMYTNSTDVTIDPDDADFLLIPGFNVGAAGGSSVLTGHATGWGESITLRSVKYTNDTWMPVARIDVGGTWSDPGP